MVMGDSFPVGFAFISANPATQRAVPVKHRTGLAAEITKQIRRGG
jgi:hypothetical protein